MRQSRWVRLIRTFANHIAKAIKKDLTKSLSENEDPTAFHVINFGRYEAFPVKEGYEKLGEKALLKYNQETKIMQTVAIRYEGAWYQHTDTFFPQAQKNHDVKRLQLKQR